MTNLRDRDWIVIDGTLEPIGFVGLPVIARINSSGWPAGPGVGHSSLVFRP